MLFIERIKDIVLCLPPKQRFVIATDLRFLYIQHQCKPLLLSMDNASRRGLVWILEWKKRNLCQLKNEYSYLAIRGAIQNGHVGVLEWWYHSGLPLLLHANRLDLDFATMNGHVSVLEWCKNSRLDLFYTSGAMMHAIYDGHFDVFEWWKYSGLKLKIPIHALEEYMEECMERVSNKFI